MDQLPDEDVPDPEAPQGWLFDAHGRWWRPVWTAWRIRCVQSMRFSAIEAPELSPEDLVASLAGLAMLNLRDDLAVAALTEA